MYVVDAALEPVPAGVAAELLERQGQTVRWHLTVAGDAPLDRTPRQVVLLVGGRPASTAPLRIWTEEVRSFRVWVPIVRAGLMKFDNQNH